ncbi:bifunctional transcriptional activator/DNA repair enzyme AdaA [Flavobacterium sp. JP2137]|uniref:bifunctional transcriptional activator/DNA repair enzyme AdaA n=1 Tax=Flavobacterium sp. JP2137 TaxID=3414510 RepID=UPI003D2FE3EA
MNEEDHIQYTRIAKAIAYIAEHFKEQPSLEELAAVVHLSPFHFHRLFTDWAGTSPKKFLQYTSLDYAKGVLRNNQGVTLSEMAFESGLSSSSRLHDLFVKIEGMTPLEYRQGGKNLTINYRYADSPFGKLLLASTAKGICYMAFEDDAATALHRLLRQFPQANFVEQTDAWQERALRFFGGESLELSTLKLHLKGTDFQLKVWESLLKIPLGQLTTYGTLAQEIGNPSASRAVGTAIGKNPIAFLIPCHRVIQSTGNLGGYMWGTTRKTAMIAWEGVQGAGETDNEVEN